MSEPQDLSKLSEAELWRMEREIAHKHIGHFPYLIVIWGLSNFVIWVSLFPLVISGILPVWAGFIVATICCAAAYLPGHDAQHDIIARPGEKLRWLNEFVGYVSTLPLVLPHRLGRLTHLEHHKHTNDPELDPDYTTRANGPLHAIWTTIQNRQPGSTGGTAAYALCAIRLGKIGVALEGAGYTVVYFGILFGMAWSGYAIEAALLWWLPKHIAMTYIHFFLSWAPHHPAVEKGRYMDTRSFRSVFGNIGSMGMQYHIVHHLHPRIPLYRTPRAYWEMKPILDARGADIHDL